MSSLNWTSARVTTRVSTLTRSVKYALRTEVARSLRARFRARIALSRSFWAAATPSFILPPVMMGWSMAPPWTPAVLLLFEGSTRYWKVGLG